MGNTSTPRRTASRERVLIAAAKIGCSVPIAQRTLDIADAEGPEEAIAALRNRVHKERAADYFAAATTTEAA